MSSDTNSKGYFPDRLFRNIIDENSDPIYISGENRVLYANQAMAELAGLESPEELAGTDEETWIHPDDVEHVKKVSGQIPRGKKHPERIRFRINTAQGEVKTVETRTEVLEFEGKRVTLRYVRDESRLVESERKYEEILDLSPMVIMTFSTSGFVTSCNQAIVDLTGFDKEEIIGKHLTQLPYLTIETVKTVVEALASIIKGRQLKPIEFKYKTKTGQHRYAKAYSKLVKTHSGRREIYAVIQVDIYIII